jgi:hypothetical protein
MRTYCNPHPKPNPNPVTPTPTPPLRKTRFADRSDGGTFKKRGDYYFQKQRPESDDAAAVAEGAAATAAAADGGAGYEFRHPRSDDSAPRQRRGTKGGAPSPHARSDPTYRKVRPFWPVVPPYACT